MSAAPTEVVVRLDAGPDADDHELAELALRLRDDFRDLDVESVDLARRGEAPPGAKSGDPLELGTLFVTIASSGVLTALINTENSWIGRRRRGSIRVKIGNDELVLTGASSEHQRRVIEEWLARRNDG